MEKPNLTWEERFWKKIEVGAEDECWPWKAKSVDRDGYASFRKHFKGKNERAHRIAYKLCVGALEDNELCLHSCDNPPCCNPGHLFKGTQLENMRDKVAKGRAATGDRNGSRLHPEKLARGARNCNAKLTDKQVKAMRERYEKGGITTRKLARFWGISQATCWKIVTRRSWTHVS